ncbi:IAH1 [Scenedesmus sp. PABB004]|nr:IAH1 [Scenedesmus sp. PABB004]
MAPPAPARLRGPRGAAALAALLALAACGAAGQSYAVSRPSVVLFGDSITEFGFAGPSGWASSLAQLYSRKADVVNRGLAGWNTRWAAAVLPRVLADLAPAREAASKAGAAPWSPRVQLLVIWFGANDAVLPGGKDGALSVPLDEFRKNLAAMVAAARAAGVPHVLLVTPPPVDEAAWAKTNNRNASDRTNAQVAAYAAAVRAVSAGAGVPVLDVHAAVSALPAAQRAAWTYDGVHPSAEGQAMVFGLLKAALEGTPALAAVRPGSLPLHLPAYNQINATAPRATFDELFDRGLVTRGT